MANGFTAKSVSCQTSKCCLFRLRSIVVADATAIAVAT